jgi:hypothetical protein
MNWRITNPPNALPAHIYISLHFVLILCDCKPLKTAAFLSARVLRARSVANTHEHAVFGCSCLSNDKSDEKILSIHSIFVYRSNEKRCRQFNHNLSENLFVDAASPAKSYENSHRLKKTIFTFNVCLSIIYNFLSPFLITILYWHLIKCACPAFLLKYTRKIINTFIIVALNIIRIEIYNG